ncbi:MAG: 50S ribosomal protein L10 [candidate division WOR-3 bacterium]
MGKAEKVKVIEELKERIKRSEAIYFVDFTGVPANDFNDLRRTARAQGLKVKVVKNQLALRALEECGVPEDIETILKGPTSVIFAEDDAVAPARLLKNFPSLKFKGAYLEKTIYPAERFDFLVNLPTKDELRTQLVGVLMSPIAELLGVLEGLLGELVWVFEEMQRRPQSQEGA